MEGPRAALALVEQLGPDGYQLFHAVRADRLRGLGRTSDAAPAYDAAVDCTENTAERDFLQSRRRSPTEG
ncbi:hypothetical protein ACFRQM_45290 [Streptomyces sp. NPDC056831]|uniref:hypothetical protein n=1 Tax=Streptomyces sp. NPDC056831 TaxID=3345954 RepID=UPI0036796CBF